MLEATKRLMSGKKVARSCMITYLMATIIRSSLHLSLVCDILKELGCAARMRTDYREDECKKKRRHKWTRQEGDQRSGR